MSSGSDEVTQKSEPWGPTQPYLKGALEDASNLYGSGGFYTEPYPYMRTAPQSDLTLAGQNYIANRANSGDQLLTGAGNTLQSAMSGGDFYNNADTIRQSIIDNAMSSVNGQFGTAGMTGSGLHAQAMGQGIAQGLAPFEYGAWENAQNRALQAAGMAPDINQSGYLGGLMLNQIGSQQDAYNQQRINDAINYWYEQQRAPQQALSDYSQMLLGYGGMGGTQTGRQSYSPGGMDYLSLGMQSLPFLFLL